MMSVSVQCEHLHTILYNPFFIGLSVCVFVGQCERTIKLRLTVKLNHNTEGIFKRAVKLRMESENKTSIKSLQSLQAHVVYLDIALITHRTRMESMSERRHHYKIFGKLTRVNLKTIFWRTTVLFVGPLIPPVLDFCLF